MKKRIEVEVKCPHCDEKNERTFKDFKKDIFIYECGKCKNQYKVRYELIATVCCKLESLIGRKIDE